MNVIDENELENALESQIPEYKEPKKENVVEQQEPKPEEKKQNVGNLQVGGTLSIKPQSHDLSNEEKEKINERFGNVKLGDNINASNDYRDGWVDVNKNVLGERADFYPEDWQFRIRPATVEAIRNWSTIDDTNINVVDDVFNEVIKSCVSIMTPAGPLPWGNIRSWDRFFFLLLVREYTFVQGERKIEYEDDCINCDNPVKFNLTSNALMYEMPDPEVMKYFSKEEQRWVIDPEEYDLPFSQPIIFYLPTLEKDAAIKAWAIKRYQDNKKVDTVFVKFLTWMAPKISKDETIATRQIKEYEMKFKSWDADTFSFMNDVINNITITPLSKLKTKCPICGEEVTSDVRFPNGVSDLFNVSSGHKKFGKK